MNKPLLFLDVDGVINVWSGHGTETEPVFGPLVTNPAEENSIVTHIPIGMRNRIQALMDAYEIVWATAWRGRAHSFHQEHLGLPVTPFPYLDWLDLKLPHIIKYAKERSWAWVDDDAKWELRQLHPALGMLPDTLIVEPDQKVGLTDEHVRELLAFAAREVESC